MKNFRVPEWRKRQINKKYSRKAKVISQTVVAMEDVMREAIDKIIEAALVSGQFFQPSLNGMNVVADKFYMNVIQEAFFACEDEKQAQTGKKRLAGRKGPKGIPHKLEDLSDIFQDKKYFKTIMRRSQAMSNRLKKAYLGKLRKKFQKIIPLLTQGEITPIEAKKELLYEWDSSKARIETIFRTETTNYFSKVQTQFFEADDDIIGFLFDANLDISTTSVCRSRHGMVFTKKHSGKNSIAYNTPALHFNCRSHWIPLANTPENRKLLEDASRDPSQNTLAPLPKGWR